MKDYIKAKQRIPSSWFTPWMREHLENALCGIVIVLISYVFIIQCLNEVSK